MEDTIKVLNELKEIDHTHNCQSNGLIRSWLKYRMPKYARLSSVNSHLEKVRW